MASVLSSIRYQTKIHADLLKLFQKIDEEGTLPNSFYEASITLTPKPNKDNIRQENYKQISLINIDVKNTQQTTSKQNVTVH